MNAKNAIIVNIVFNVKIFKIKNICTKIKRFQKRNMKIYYINYIKLVINLNN